MKNKLTLYHEASSGGFKQWSIWMEKDKQTVTVEWGKVGHKLQTSSDTAKPKGTPGTKSYVDEYGAAQFNLDKQIRKKREEGYRESMDDAEVLDIFVGLTKRFVPAKPRKDVAVDTLYQLDYESKLWIQRKRDGQRHLVLITSKGEVKIYSRRMDDMTAHFPTLCGWIKHLKLPKKTILDGEIIIDRNGKDDFRAVGTIVRAKPEKAAPREIAFANAGQLRFMVFDCLYFAGKPVWEKPYEYRYHEVLCNYLAVGGTSHVFVPEILNGGIGVLMTRAKAEGWEGLVCWLWEDPTIVRDGGKPKRTGCIKWKPKKEQDFIATGYYLGSGDMQDVVGGLNIEEYMPDGSIRSCGNVGCFRGDSIIRKEALSWDYPCVVSVEFDLQEPEGTLRFPVVLKLHEDKLPEDCVAVDEDEDE